MVTDLQERCMQQAGIEPPFADALKHLPDLRQWPPLPHTLKTRMKQISNSLNDTDVTDRDVTSGSYLLVVMERRVISDQETKGARVYQRYFC